MTDLLQAFELVLDPYVLAVIAGSAVYGMLVGAIPGLTATMATALLIPVTFFMPPIPAVAAIVTATAMAIFSGDIPGCLLRMPGTPASAAYTDEAYAMTRSGRAETALGAGLFFSALGGLFGTAVLIVAAPALADFALNFSSFEYFWLVLLGLSCAVFISGAQVTKGIAALLLGLFISCIGLQNPAGVPRFTFGSVDLMGGINAINVMVGLFAVSEVMRAVLAVRQPVEVARRPTGNVLAGQVKLLMTYPLGFLRGSVLGTIVGILPGAGADIAAWMSYAVSKRFSKTPEKFGTGHVEGIIESGSANNSALAGAWVPALVFGIPGDSITAIAIGVLYLKGLNPGPTLFIEQAPQMYAIFLIFILANIVMIPLGLATIRAARQILLLPRSLLSPTILMFCIVGAFAIENSLLGVLVILVFGVIGFVMEENGFPVAPLILGLILGPMLEDHFFTSMIKADGNLLAFFERPIAGTLGALAVAIWALVLLAGLRRAVTSAPRPSAH
ncbi:tripartite tricarboxylate transporter permease [Inquilinus sp. Marseille-Q2685]|uniref:tripartite tricarboxylate transporter permease n=1 Tax=Inquilinus sp. Marseille-Q2685 TaxID=2866581 RepID=UPI001CE4008D|nr:tripartite tricarboxylate transporter permease [Inquilinus sp. Marseille-Q2685]